MTIRNLTCSELEARLGEYLEGTLEDAGAADVELHLSGCTACAALVRDIEGIVREAAALPSLAPSRDLWPAIEARLVSTRPDSLTPAGRASAGAGARADVIDFAERAAQRAANNSVAHDRSRPAFAWRRLRTGALAAGLVAVTAVATWFAARQLPPQTAASAPDNSSRPGGDSTLPSSAGTAPVGAAPVTSGVAGGDPRGGTPAPQVADRGRPSGDAALTPVNSAARPALTATLTQEITALRGVLTDRREELDPRTVAILESSLSTIDSAITEARRALQTDPASRFLSSQLDKALEKKLGLLRTAALLPART